MSNTVYIIIKTHEIDDFSESEVVGVYYNKDMALAKFNDFIDEVKNQKRWIDCINSGKYYENNKNSEYWYLSTKCGHMSDSFLLEEHEIF